MENPTIELNPTEIQNLLAALDLMSKDQQLGGLKSMQAIFPLAAKLSQHGVALQESTPSADPNEE